MEEKERQILSQDFPKDFESPIVEKILDDVENETGLINKRTFENSDKIKLPKKAIKKIESPFWQGYEVLFPASSKYAGYKTKISEYFISETPEYFLIKRIFENATFTLEKAEREQGKRYKRYEISWGELYTELGEYNEMFSREGLPTALVMYNEYEYSKRGVELWRYTLILLGKHTNIWCYTTDSRGNEERHRISAKRFRIVKDNLTSAEIKRFTELLQERSDIENDLLGLDKIENEFYKLDTSLEEEKFARLSCKWNEFKEEFALLTKEKLDRLKAIMIELGIEENDAGSGKG